MFMKYWILWLNIKFLLDAEFASWILIFSLNIEFMLNDEFFCGVLISFLNVKNL